MTTKRVVGLGLVFVTCGALAAGAEAQVAFDTLWVDTTTGIDSAGTTGYSADSAFASVNMALQRAWDINHGLYTDPLAPNITRVKVRYSALPIAPDGFGSTTPPVTEGNECFGWIAQGEAPRKPFPIRMQPGVDLIGVPDPVTQALQRIVIDEAAMGGSAQYLDWTPGGIPPCFPEPEPGTFEDFWCIVRGANNCKLQGFDIDGSFLNNKTKCKSSWPGVYAAAVSGFQIRNCDIHGWHDEVCLASSGRQTSVTVDGCIIRDAWPLTNDPGTPIDDTDFGHAGLWATGAGTIFLTVIDTIFRNAHDGIEIAPLGNGTCTAAITGGSRFELTENGLELAETNGKVTIFVDSTVFLRNHNRPDEGGTSYGTGSAFPVSTGAVIIRRNGQELCPVT